MAWPSIPRLLVVRISSRADDDRKDFLSIERLIFLEDDFLDLTLGEFRYDRARADSEHRAVPRRRRV